MKDTAETTEDRGGIMGGNEESDVTPGQAYRRKIEYDYCSLYVRDDAEVDDPYEPWRCVVRGIRRDFPHAHAWLEPPKAGTPGLVRLAVARNGRDQELTDAEMEVISQAWNDRTAHLNDGAYRPEDMDPPWLLGIGVRDYDDLNGMTDECLSFMLWLGHQGMAFIQSDYAAYKRTSSPDALGEMSSEWCRLACLDWQITQTEEGRWREKRRQTADTGQADPEEGKRNLP